MLSGWVTEAILCSTYGGLLGLIVVIQWLYHSSRALVAQARKPGFSFRWQQAFRFTHSIKHIYHHLHKSKQLLKRSRYCHLKQLYYLASYMYCFPEHVFMCQQPKCESQSHYLLYSFNCRKCYYMKTTVQKKVHVPNNHTCNQCTSFHSWNACLCLSIMKNTIKYGEVYNALKFAITIFFN